VRLQAACVSLPHPLHQLKNNTCVMLLCMNNFDIIFEVECTDLIIGGISFVVFVLL
jgi:hypothetical protein